MSGTTASTVNAANNTVTITVPVRVYNGDSIWVVTTGVTNPAVGTYAKTAFALHTSMDIPDVNPTAGGSAATVAASGKASFTANVTDHYGNGVTDAIVTWSASSDSIDESGAFAAGITPGSSTITATVFGASGPVSGTATITVMLSPVTSARGSRGAGRFEGVARCRAESSLSEQRS